MFANCSISFDVKLHKLQMICDLLVFISCPHELIYELTLLNGLAYHAKTPAKHRADLAYRNTMKYARQPNTADIARKSLNIEGPFYPILLQRRPGGPFFA